MELKYYDLIDEDGDSIKVAPIAMKYADNKTLAVYLYTEDMEPYADITVNIENGIADYEMAYVDVNNFPWAEAFIKENGIGKPMGVVGRSGFCTYPLYFFNLDMMTQYEEE